MWVPKDRFRKELGRQGGLDMEHGGWHTLVAGRRIDGLFCPSLERV